MGHYPFGWQLEGLCPEDFLHFSKQFSQTVLQLLPFAAGPVLFFDPDDELDETLGISQKPKYWKKYIKCVLKRQRSVLAAEKPVLFMPVWNSGAIIGVSVVEGVDPQFAKVLSEEWLSDRSRIFSREFFLQKQQYCDPLTGMFNSLFFNEIIDGILSDRASLHKAVSTDKKKSDSRNVSLFLIEVHPPASNADRALNDIVRAGYHLESFLGQGVLYHLGSGVFGIVGRNLDEEQAKQLGKNILSWFRRDGFRRIHIGINTIDPEVEMTEVGFPLEQDGSIVLDQTWAALRKASRRGPYALCTYSSISNPESHPLKRIKPSVMARLRKLWAEVDVFALLLVSRDKENPGEVLSKRLLALIEAQATVVPINEYEVFVFLKDADVWKAEMWIRDFKKKLPLESGSTCSIGIAYYPCVDFKKSDIPQNGRKALQHAGFFGPDSMVVFDGVSQNVSGDIFYGEGDLVRAVNEYRKGLELEPANTNLLNSLGEAYARMNKPKKAREYFEKLLVTDPKHYMGLFNLGITYLTTGEDEEAIKYFEKTLSVSRRKRQAIQINDLLLQLSKLYCRTGRYDKVINLLAKEKLLSESSRKVQGREVLLRYLGEAYLEKGRYNEAIKVLQRAVRYTPHDAASLSMLGESYAVQNQGDDIALSLCLQAVNTDDSNWQHWYRLAGVQYRMKQYESALDALKECLLRERKCVKALSLTGRIYAELGNKSKAAGMFRKVLKIDPEQKAAATVLDKLLQL
ncbi:MAG: tetratricopeptide repeat protein [Deltaproteobacteria bacterium]|jgi:Flp pilus assembly protein TadD|nr:tetratricopeptide repeat protein [Deltaproteobacteria bacterium]